MTDELNLRADLIETCHEMAGSGLTFGTSGNASARLDKESLLITPSGVDYEALQPADIVRVTFDGQFFGSHAPSSEWRFHRDILAEREDTQAIVHTHSLMATAVACQRQAIPSFHYMVAVAGGADIRCASYATFGTQALSDNLIQALGERYACLMANHGQVALGHSLKEALRLAGEVEVLAHMYWHARQGGNVTLLDDTEMAVVLEKFKTYGTNRIGFDGDAI